MPAFVPLLIALPPLLLLLGIVLGLTGARWWWRRRAAALAERQAADEEAAAGASDAAEVAVALPPGRKASAAKLQRGIHIVASSASLPSEACLPLSLRLGAADTPPVPMPAPPLRYGAGAGAHRPARLQTPDPTQPDSPGGCDLGGSGSAAAPPSIDVLSAEEQLRSLVGSGMGGSGSLSPGGPMGHRKTGSMDLGQLVRAGPFVISQVGAGAVRCPAAGAAAATRRPYRRIEPRAAAHFPPCQVMEDWDARSTLYRIMSGMDAFAAPGSPVAAASLPPAAALFSPGGGAGGGGAGPSMPPGEVHMDEIDLIECIGKGGYGCAGRRRARGAAGAGASAAPADGAWPSPLRLAVPARSCVYKASWRGAGVAVKYIKCPTDDSDSLGRAIREVRACWSSARLSLRRNRQDHHWQTGPLPLPHRWCCPRR